MGRGKLTMKLIANEKSRRTTFYKRKKSLMRKAYELSTLCDIRTCVFIYGSKQNDGSSVGGELHTWPPCRNDIDDMINSYKANCLQKRARKVFDLHDFFTERKKKVEAEMSKLQREVAEAKYPKWDDHLEYLLEDQLRLLMEDLDSKLDGANQRINFMTENREGTSGIQTLNSSFKQELLFEDQTPMFGNPTMAPQNLQMGNSMSIPVDHDMESLSQFLFGSNGSAQIQYNYGSFQTPIYSETTNGMMEMNNNSSNQNYSICHYGVPGQTVLPLSYMQFQNDQFPLPCASSNSQMLLGNASAQLSYDQFDFINYEYLMKPNHF